MVIPVGNLFDGRLSNLCRVVKLINSGYSIYIVVDFQTD